MKLAIPSLLCWFALCSCCTNGYKYTGSIRDKTSLPWIDFRADGMLGTDGVEELRGPVATRSLEIGCTKKINAGQVIPTRSDRDLQFLEYRAISQDADGHSSWQFDWRHRRYGVGRKTLHFRGDPIYAISKSDFRLGLIPHDQKSEHAANGDLATRPTGKPERVDKPQPEAKKPQP